MKTLTPAALAAKAIRAELKSAGVKASVKTANYAGGSSVRIVLENAAPWTLDAVESGTDKYSYQTFDGMTDCQGIKNQDFKGPQCGYVFVDVDYSDDLMQAAWDIVRADLDDAPVDHNEAWKVHDLNRGYNGGTMIRLELKNAKSPLWSKPRLRVAA